MEAEVRVMPLLEGSHKPSDVGSHWKLEKARTDSFLEPPEGTQPCRYLDVSPVRLTFTLLTSKTVR